MAADTTIAAVNGVIRREMSFSRAKELKYSDFGIIKFAKNSTVFCEQFG
jgi:hypothetical protein